MAIERAGTHGHLPIAAPGVGGHFAASADDSDWRAAAISDPGHNKARERFCPPFSNIAKQNGLVSEAVANFKFRFR